MNSADRSAAEDPKVIDRLDAYLAALQAGGQPDKSKVLSDDPALAGHLECLEVLEKLAPPNSEKTLPYIPHDGDQAGVETTDSIAPAKGQEVAAGSVFGQYELIRELGRGGMGVVYLAKQRELDRLVALKMILSNFLASEHVIHRFHIEAKAAARLRHPHIVQVFDTGRCHGQYYFAMDYVDGWSLEERLQSGPMPAADAASLMIPVARAVAHLHQHGIVHRDLKPSNILIDRTGHPYLTDFGLAKMLEGGAGKTATGMVMGTPSYMAPEQAASGREIGPLCDVYSLGAILYEMLAGRPPFREATPMDTLVQVLEGEPTPPRQINPAIPRDLEVVCLKCLEKPSGNRYPSAAAFADDLERYLHHEPVEAKPHGPVQKLVRWGRRQPALASRLLSLCVLIAIVEAHAHWSASPRAAEINLAVLAILASWGAASCGCQMLLARPGWGARVPFIWSTLDTVLFTAIVFLTRDQTSPVLIGFPALIVAAGLWFRVRLVWFTTALTVISYLMLAEWSQHPQHPAIFLLVLTVIGFMVAYQVQRVRVLSRYYEHRPLP